MNFKTGDRVKMSSLAFQRGLDNSGAVTPSTTGVVISTYGHMVCVLRDGRKSLTGYNADFWEHITEPEHQERWVLVKPA